MRNWYGLFAVLVTGGTVAAVCLYASAVVQAGFGYTMTWFLLLGGVRPIARAVPRTPQKPELAHGR